MLGGRYYPMGVFTPVYPNNVFTLNLAEIGFFVQFSAF